MSTHRSLSKLKRLQQVLLMMLHEQREVMCLVPAALASRGWFVVVNEAEKMLRSEWNSMLFYHFKPSSIYFGCVPFWLKMFTLREMQCNVKLNTPGLHWICDETMMGQHEDVSNIRQAAAQWEHLQRRDNGCQNTPPGFSSIIGSYL